MSETLTPLMNAMIGRLEYTQRETLGPIPEDKYWDMIQIYIALDDVLAALYKQYCMAKDNLGTLVLARGSEDPMTEIAWEMHESARCAVETRLLELKEDSDIHARAAQMKALRSVPKTEYSRPPAPSDDLDQTIVFLLMASMVMKSSQRRQDIRRDFVRAR